MDREPHLVFLFTDLLFQCTYDLGAGAAGRAVAEASALFLDVLRMSEEGSGSFLPEECFAGVRKPISPSIGMMSALTSFFRIAVAASSSAVPAAASHFSAVALASAQAEGAAMRFFTASVSVFLISSVMRIILSCTCFVSVYLLYLA